MIDEQWNREYEASPETFTWEEYSRTGCNSFEIFQSIYIEITHSKSVTIIFGASYFKSGVN